jgi:Zn-dependent M32 family carboxypeptidase
MTPERIADVRQYILDLERELDDYIKSQPDVEDACGVLYEMNMIKRDMSSVYDSLSTSVGQLIADGKNVQLKNGGVIEKKSSYERRAWQHKDLASVVAQKLVRMSVDMDTGEIIKSPEEIAMQVLDYVQPSYWRVKELSSLGINVDNYCETGVLKTSIIVRKGEANDK